MCKICDFIESVFRAAEADPHPNYLPTLALLGEVARQGRIELFAGDCSLAEAADVLSGERHYTVCHYFRCRGCGRYAFIGACIRGTPVYKLLDSLGGIHLETMLWGRVGTHFGRGG